MLKKFLLTNTVALLILSILVSQAEAGFNQWIQGSTYSVQPESLEVYTEPNTEANPLFRLYENMEIVPNKVREIEGETWLSFGTQDFWVQATDELSRNLKRIRNPEKHEIVDLYGILDLPHNYAVKLVKFEGAAEGRIETYKKIGDKYVLQYIYDTYYRKEGMKDTYGDLKTVGGNAVRYLYRTTKSGMNGYDSTGQHFGVYKVSYPMPHDALPKLVEGSMSIYQYNKLPTINYNNGVLYPHPHSNLGADIVLHTKARGSRGCINIENDEMSFMYHSDLVTENDTEIIPFVIYDEGVNAPPIGILM